ncbi:MAG: beta-lactamase family protein [Treponema sp.]|nr:beta-lactamase family protein [Treponema sp.]
MRKFIFLLTVCVSLFAGCSSKDLFDCEEIRNPSYSEEIEKIEAYLDGKNFGGAVLISKNKDIVLAKGYGPCDKKNPEAGQIQINTTFEIGSISKQMTAAAIMQLVQKKKLKLTDKISRWFPDFQYGNDITVEMLLNMHSGLTDCLNAPFEFFPRKIANQIENATVRNEPVEEGIILKYLNEAPLFIEPGTEYFYCNTNYYLLAKIVEQVSGLSFREYMQKNIFVPCHMDNTNMEFQKTDTRGYDWKNRYYSIPDEFSTGYGDINSSVVDLYKWTQAFVNGKVVRKKTFKKMINTDSYGYGVNVQNGEIFHGGATNVFNSFATYHPKTKTTIIILMNVPQNEKYAATFAREVYKLMQLEEK